MNQQLEIPQPPNPVSRNVGSDFTSIKNQSGALSAWCNDFTVWLKNKLLPPLVGQVNSQTQGFSTRSSAGSVSLSSAITHITGNQIITMLSAPATFSGVAWLVADGPFSLGTGGNIAVSMGPCTIGETIRITFDGGTQKWYPSHDYTYFTPSSSPFLLPTSSGSFQEIEVKNTTGARLQVLPTGADTIDLLPHWDIPSRASARFIDGAQGNWSVSPKSAGTFTTVVPTSGPYALPQAIGSFNWQAIFNANPTLSITVNVFAGDAVFPSTTSFLLAANGGKALLADYTPGFWARLI